MPRAAARQRYEKPPEAMIGVAPGIAGGGVRRVLAGVGSSRSSASGDVRPLDRSAVASRPALRSSPRRLADDRAEEVALAPAA
jgi:hypothetical protein